MINKFVWIDHTNGYLNRRFDRMITIDEHFCLTYCVLKDIVRDRDSLRYNYTENALEYKGVRYSSPDFLAEAIENDVYTQRSDAED